MFKKLGFLAVVAVAGMLIMQSCTKTTEKTITGPTVYDTTQVTVHDTLRVTVHDTLRIHDTTHVTIHDTLRVTVHDTVTVNAVGVGAAYVAMQNANVAALAGYYFDFSVLSAVTSEASALGDNSTVYGATKTATNTWSIVSLTYIWNGGSNDGYYVVSNIVKYLGGNPDLASSWSVTDPPSGVARKAITIAKRAIN